MTPKEQEIAIRELEERVDRLRALYDQYFMGYERLEPTVPRKEVERRFAILRKDQIRNTAMRFKFNVINQKYNTYSMFWQRICRQIEEGTYKRHVQRAKARFGRAAGPGGYDIDIDVDLGDFDAMDDGDMDAMLAQANADAEAYANGGGASDTVPPAPLDRVPGPAKMPTFGASPTAYVKPGPAARRMQERVEIDDDDDDDLDTVRPPAPKLEAPLTPDRPHRPVKLPEGARGRVVVRRGGGPPPSGRLPSAPDARESAPMSTRERAVSPGGGVPQAPTTGRGVPQAPTTGRGVPQAPTTGRGVPQPPPSQRGVPQPPPSQRGVPQAPTTGRGLPHPPPSQRGVPHAPTTGRGQPPPSQRAIPRAPGSDRSVNDSADGDERPKPRPSVPPARRVPLPSHGKKP